MRFLLIPTKFVSRFTQQIQTGYKDKNEAPDLIPMVFVIRVVLRRAERKTWHNFKPRNGTCPFQTDPFFIMVYRLVNGRTLLVLEQHNSLSTDYYSEYEEFKFGSRWPRELPRGFGLLTVEMQLTHPVIERAPRDMSLSLLTGLKRLHDFRSLLVTFVRTVSIGLYQVGNSPSS